MKDNAAILLLAWIWTAVCCAARQEELHVSCGTWYLSCPVPLPFWWEGGVPAFPKERRAWCISREKAEGVHWNLTAQTSLNGTDSPGPGEEGWKLISTSIHGLCARLGIHLSKIWYLFEPQLVSTDTREQSKGEYALSHWAGSLYLMVTFDIDQEQISSALRSWQSAFFSQGILFAPCLSALFLPPPSFSWCKSLYSLYFICWSDQELNIWYLLMKLLLQWEGQGSSLKLTVVLRSL